MLTGSIAHLSVSYSLSTSHGWGYKTQMQKKLTVVTNGFCVPPGDDSRTQSFIVILRPAFIARKTFPIARALTPPAKLSSSA